MSSLAEKQSCSSTTSTSLGFRPAASKHFLAASRDMSYPTWKGKVFVTINPIICLLSPVCVSITFRFLTILMQLFSSNVDTRSVTISWATISTAWFCRWYFLTKGSLAKTAAPAPSDVGLRGKEDKKKKENKRHGCQKVKWLSVTDDKNLYFNQHLCNLCKFLTSTAGA